MSLEQKEQEGHLASMETSEPSEATPVRFCCPYCEMVLEVLPAQVGVRGPCPGCGKEIEAPPPGAVSPQTIEIKPRPPRPARGGEEGTSNSGELRGRFPIPALGTPPPAPPPELPKANPPVPAQPRIPEQRGIPRRRHREVEPADWGRAGSTRRRRRRKGGTGRSVDPITGKSDRYRERRELIAIVKLILAILVTLALTIVIAKVTKNSFRDSSGEIEPLLPKNR